MNSNSLNNYNFKTKTDMNVKICFHTKLCTQNRIFDSKCKISNNKDFRFCASYLEKVDSFLVLEILEFFSDLGVESLKNAMEGALVRGIMVYFICWLEIAYSLA